MDLAFSPAQRALADAAACWLDAHLRELPAFGSPAEEIAWGRRWQAELAADRWVGLPWPAEYGGRGASPLEVALVNIEFGRRRAPQPVNRVGVNLVGPTLLARGTPEQRARWLPSILDASELWCQLFSEPAAGSDLASLSTRATRCDAGGWRLTGAKVWTSYAQFAEWGLCLARTDPQARKHRGISCFALDMHAPGVTVRPLVQITGEAEFNEVFLDDVAVPADCLIGAEDDGWSVAGTTLAHERGTTFPLKEQTVHEVHFGRLLDAAATAGALDDLVLADDVAAVYVELRLLALANLAMLSRLAAGDEPGPESSVVKLTWSRLSQHLSQSWLALAPFEQAAQRQFLWSKAASIAGGTSEVQRTIIGERLLGLPRG